MERSVVHHNHSSFWKCWKQIVLKPFLKQFMGHRSGVLAGRDDFASHLSRHNAGTHIFAPFDPAMNQLPSGSVAVLPVKIAVNACFIHICYVFRWNISYFVFVLSDFVVILLFVCDSLFFRVIFNRFSAF